MHIYYSALAFTPRDTELFQRYKGLYGGNVGVVNGVERGWNPLIAVLRGHGNLQQGYFNCMASPRDGSRIASGHRDGTIQLWDVKTGAHIATLEGYPGSIKSLLFSADGSRLVSAHLNYAVELWDGVTYTHITTLGGRVDPFMTMSVGGSILALASFTDRVVQLWDTKKGAIITSLDAYPRSVAFSVDGSRLVFASSNGGVQLWDGRTGAHLTTLEEHSNLFVCPTFSAGGSRLAFWSNDMVQLWDSTTGAHIANLGHFVWVTAVTFAMDGSRLALLFHDSNFSVHIRLWDGKTGAPIATLEAAGGRLNIVTFSADGSRLASVSSYGTVVQLWDGKTGALVAPLEGHSQVNSVTFSTDGSRLASASSDKTLRIWDSNTGALIHILAGHSGSVERAIFLADDSRLASNSSDGSIRLWDAKTVTLLTLEGHSDKVTSVAFSADGSRLASKSNDNTVRLWYGETGAHVTTFRTHVGRAMYLPSAAVAVAVSADGLRLASASRFGVVELWDGEAGARIATIERDYRSVQRVTPSAHIQEDVSRALAPWSNPGAVKSMGFSTDCSTLALTFYDGITQLHDSGTGNYLNSTCQPLLDDVFHLGGPELPFHFTQRKWPPLHGLVLGRPSVGNNSNNDPLFWFPLHLHPTCMALNPSRSLLAVGCENGEVILLDVSQVLSS